MTHVFPRHSNARPPRAVRGDGAYIIDAAGKRYLDGSGGAAVSCLGHSDPEVTQAIKDQADRIAFAHTGFFTSGPAERLADRLDCACSARDRAGLSRLRRVGGGGGGSEARATVFP